MDNRQIARLLRETADLMEIAGEDPFRVRGYRRAADSVAAAEPLAALVDEPGRLRSLPGIGPKLAEALTVILGTGSLPLHEELLERYQPGMLELLRVQGLGPKTIALIWEHRGAATVDAVEALAREGKLRDLPRMSAKKEGRILQALAAYRRLSGRFLRSTAARAAVAIANALSPLAPVIEVAGSYRRGCETVGGLDLAAIAPADPATILNAFVTLPAAAAVNGQGADFAEVQWTDGPGAALPVRLRLAPRSSFGALLLRATGPERHWEHLCQRAAGQQLLLDGGGLRRGGETVAGADEAAIYQALGLPWIPPELREYVDVSARAVAPLPPLVTVGDIRADLHMHTVETDGRATIEEMAAAAIAHGYRAIAITDHSQALAMAHGLNEDRALAHIARIRAADRVMGERLRILPGIEVDILADGRLDLADEVLAGMDIVIASIHSRFDQPQAESTARLLRAIANPHVRVLGHPTGRRLLRREPLAMDADAVARACAAAGVVMEINASPERLDLNADLARSAAAHGVRFAINTDAHHPEHLDFIAHGIATARRAGLAAEQIVNTREPEALLAALRPKPPRETPSAD